jgi:predicted transcriptional regulator
MVSRHLGLYRRNKGHFGVQKLETAMSIDDLINEVKELENASTKVKWAMKAYDSQLAALKKKLNYEKKKQRTNAKESAVL